MRKLPWFRRPKFLRFKLERESSIHLYSMYAVEALAGIAWFFAFLRGDIMVALGALGLTVITTAVHNLYLTSVIYEELKGRGE